MEQTNRTILFEEINPDMKNIFTYMDAGNQESLSDSCINEIHSALAISSFEEFMQKFAPSVYICIDQKEKEIFCTSSIEQVRIFSSGKDVDVSQILFNEKNLLLRYFMDILDGKMSGALEDCIGENIVSLLAPELDENDFFIDFARVINCYTQGNIEKMDGLLYDFTRKYNNSLFLIKMLLQLFKKELNMQETQRKMRNFCVENRENKWQVCIEAIAMEYKKQYAYLTSCEVEGYEGWIKKGTTDISGGELFRNIFDVLVFVARGDMDQLQELYCTYSDLYADILEKMWNCSKPIIEKFMGIRAFFAQSKGIADGTVQLLITNAKIQSLSNPKNHSMLQVYLKTVNAKLYNENTIWYAIIPRLPYVDEMKRENIRERFSGNRHTNLSETQDFEGYLALVPLLAENKIQVFCSPVSTEHTSVEWVYDNGVDEWIEYQENLARREYADYIYPCFPNFSFFTESYLEVGSENKIWLKMPCVEASYVAAGMYAAFQNPQYLKTFFSNMVDESIPGVGFRVMMDNNNLKISCSLKAGVFLYSNEIMDYISRKVCGVFFAPYGSVMVIAQDRALSGLSGSKNCVSQIQTMTYLERVICKETQDFKTTLIEQFFQHRPNSLSAKWNQNKGYVNSILKKEEELVYRLDKEKKECVFEFIFPDTMCQTKVRTN